MSKDRTEAFSDGVFAVAITLLVLNIAVPNVGRGGLGEALKAQWPVYASYAVSFLTIGIIWVNHHAVFRYIKEVDRTLLFCNLFLLMAVAIIPFSTNLLGRYLQAGHDDRIAAAVYGGVMAHMSLWFGALWGYAVTHPHLLSSHLDAQRARATFPRFASGVVIYLLTIGIAFINAKLSLAVYALLAVYYVFDQLKLPVKADERSGKPVAEEELPAPG